MRKLSTLLLILGLVSFATPAHAIIVTYTDFSSWQAAVNNLYHEITDLPGAPGSTLAAGDFVPLDHSGNLAFSKDMLIEKIGDGWATWSHGYGGEVAWTNGASSVSGTFSGSGSQAFGMEIEPNDFGTHTITVTLSDGSVIEQDVTGDSGADFFGWTSTDEEVNSFDITSDGDFALGNIVEGGSTNEATVPEPLSLSLLGIGLSGLIFGRRHKVLG